PGFFTVRYLGAEGGVYRLQAVDDCGSQLALFECARPCRIVKRTTNTGWSKEAVLAGSLLEAAILDASDGLLVKSTSISPETLTAVANPSARADVSNPPQAHPAPPILSGRWSSYSSKITEGWNTEPTFG